MSTPPTPTPPAPGYTHHMHHLNLASLHPTFNHKFANPGTSSIPGAPGAAPGPYQPHLGHHHHWNGWNVGRGGCGRFNRAPVRTKVFWFVLGVGASTLFSRRSRSERDQSYPQPNPTTFSSPSPSPASALTTNDDQHPSMTWRCKTHRPASYPPHPHSQPHSQSHPHTPPQSREPNSGKESLHLFLPLPIPTPTPSEVDKQSLTDDTRRMMMETFKREEAIRQEFEGFTKKDIQSRLAQINEGLNKLDDKQLERLGKMVRDFERV